MSDEMVDPGGADSDKAGSQVVPDKPAPSDSDGRTDTSGDQAPDEKQASADPDHPDSF